MIIYHRLETIPEYQPAGLSGGLEQLLPVQPDCGFLPFEVDETLLEQGSTLINEDALWATSRLSIVCDGATSLDTARASGAESDSSGGQKAAAITASVFAADPDRDLAASARAANKAIREAMISEQVDTSCREQLWSTSFAAVQIDSRTVRWCQIGDCAIVALHADGSRRLLHPLPNHDEAVLQRWQRIGPGAAGTIHQELADDIVSVRRAMNREFGVLNGEDAAMDFLSCGCLENDQISALLLFSDGLFPPSSSPGTPLDTEQLMQLYQSGGLRGIRDHIRRLQRSDRACLRYPRFKIFDDISAVALRKRI